MWTVLLDGDLNLSMTMTFLSTIAAMGMMPLWLFVYGRYYLNFSRINIPYHMIALSLLQLVLPCLAGIGVRRCRPAVADKLVRLIKPLAIFFIIFIVTFGTYANYHIYKLMADYPYLLPIGACLPWLGFAGGLLIALVCRQGEFHARKRAHLN